MLDQGQRRAILELHKAGNSNRSISESLGVSREAVDDVIERGTDEVPRIVRPELAAPYHEEILAQYVACKGNLVRVHEEIVAKGAKLAELAQNDAQRKTA